MGDHYSNWIASRAWMYNRIDPETNNISRDYQMGVEGFMEFASMQPFARENKGKFYCPCSSCKNENFLAGRKISNHLLGKGFMPGYYVWYNHGEEINVNLGTSGGSNINQDSGGQEQEVWREEGAYVDMVNNAFCQTMNPENLYQDEEGGQNFSGPNAEAKKFYEMLEAAQTPLYDGCQGGHTKLSVASRMMNIKAANEMSENCVDQWTELIKEILPEGNTATSSYYELEKLMRHIGLPLTAIDVCIANCMIFWREDEKFDSCKFCGHPRYKPSEGRTDIPYSRMWYLPIGDRLKRLYQSDKTASAMRWHAEHESPEGEMCHPSDAGEWKNFNKLHPDFASEPRNVYLGLCTDGFNPFGMSKNHSLWPVIMTPYNLPPDMCMKREYLFLTVMNSGPNHPRGSLDIFLRPLIEELKELWHTGVEAYDVSTDTNFTLRAVLLWTISDFPAYGMLSGWTTHGKLSCPICMEDTMSFQLPKGRKACWFDCHRRFLPLEHRLRKNKNNFLKGRTVTEAPRQNLTGEEVLNNCIRYVKPSRTCDVGGNGHEVKADGYGKWHNWHKESIFWELPYWRDLNLRHNLDLMHIEKNFFDNIMNTIMNVPGKTKDTLNSRLDVARFCNRKELHVDERGRAPVPIFRLSAAAKKALLECVKNDVKFPDGYASDLAACADFKDGKFSGMKSHDCHVFMERLLPFILSELLPASVSQTLSEIGGFFRDICSRTLQASRVQTLKENIVVIMCNLEKIFPPSFFDVMEHVVVHIPEEAELGGPVQYRWMYPPERLFKHLKGKAKNRRYPGGSIVQSYLNDEISYFSEHYFANSIRTKARSTRFEEGKVPIYPMPVPEMFTHVGRPSGQVKKVWFTEQDYNCAHAYVLRNCEYFRPLESLHEQHIRYYNPQLSDDEVSLKGEHEFPTWVKKYVSDYSRNHSAEEAFPTWVQEIVQGPRNYVRSWPKYYTRGYMFHTKEYGQHKVTSNYGVCVRGQNYSDALDEEDFFGNLLDIIELKYQGLVGLRITLFKCKWYDPTIGKGTRVRKGSVVDVLSNGKYHKYEPFILAAQADQVSFVPYPSTKSSREVWLNVLKINPRSNIVGHFKGKELVLLQQDNGDDVTPVEDIAVGRLADDSSHPDYIDSAVADAEPTDEFRGHLSSSSDEDIADEDQEEEEELDEA